MIALELLPVILAGWIAGSRVLYRRWRPSTIPVNCHDLSTYHTHYERCYRRNEGLMIDTSGEAVTFALLAGLLWPAVLLVLGLAWLVRCGNEPATPAEMKARIAELEREAGISADRP